MKEDKKKKSPHFLEKPLYPGGAKALRAFISAHLQYPQDAMEQRIEGVVTVAYQVNDDGYVESPTIVKSLCPSCDEEALRLVRLLRYDKARNRGIRLKVNTKLNINFHLAPTPVRSTISYTLQPSSKPKPQGTKKSPEGSGDYGYTITLRRE
ncbi:MAG: energy transducer TonB [Bacteroidales bacterium]|nr:energy transducer TonB [Bacteroidales bacterium]